MKVFASRLQRRVPIDHILASIDPSIDHCIVAGDFNTFTKANCKAIFEPFHEARYQLVTDAVGSTYNYWYLLNKKASLDHIFIKGMTIINAGKVADRKPSDHIPIWGELNLKSDDQY
jgi:endonuclease/exonuclease/phosphatase family metal-dependent hydrolase